MTEYLVQGMHILIRNASKRQFLMKMDNIFYGEVLKIIA